MQSPTEDHWIAVKRILLYLKHTLTYGLLLQPLTRMQLHGFTDADWAGCSDDRKSTNGYGIFLGSNLLSWSSKKQATVARSSTEAEYRGVALASCKLLWFQYFLSELGFSIRSPTIVWCDNIGAIYLSANPIFHGRTKHVEIDVHFVRDLITKRRLDVRYLSTVDQLADIFTKPLGSKRFIALRGKLTVAQSRLRECVKEK